MMKLMLLKLKVYNMRFLDVYTSLNEKLIMPGGGRRYNQAVFIAGGGGSGKSTAINYFMDPSSYKLFNVDDIKELITKLKDFPDDMYRSLRSHILLGKPIEQVDLKSEEDTVALHLYIKKIGLDSKKISSVYNTLIYELERSGKLPNFLFDMTFKSILKNRRHVNALIEIGYNPNDIHVVWVLTEWFEALARNATRSRFVSPEEILRAHKDVRRVFDGILEETSSIIGANAINGDIFVALNTKGSVKWKSGSTGGPKEKDLALDFSYVKLKPRGGTIDKSKVKLVREWMDAFTPKDFDTL